MAKCKHWIYDGGKNLTTWREPSIVRAPCYRPISKTCPRHTDWNCNIIPAPRKKPKMVREKCWITHFDFSEGRSQMITKNKTAREAGWLPCWIVYKKT